MRIIIAPAKKMDGNHHHLAPWGLPPFIAESEQLRAALCGLSPGARQTLWQCGDAIAALNSQRLEQMDLYRNLTPAILSYQGIQYQYMAPRVFEDDQFHFLQTHLRILSGFYGLLRPFDGVTPYRLEMGAKLVVQGHDTLYSFWGPKLAHHLAAETDLVVNLASKEYSRAVEPHLPSSVRFLTCTFGELVHHRVVEKGTLCKMARGLMVRWLAEHSAARAEDLCHFCDYGYRYDPARSTPDNMVFLRADGPTRPAPEG